MFIGSIRKLNSHQVSTVSSSSLIISNWLKLLPWNKTERRLLSTSTTTTTTDETSEPEPPQHHYCCESGCTNCVWIDYAERLFDYHIKRIQKKMSSKNNDDDYNIMVDKEDALSELVKRLRNEINQVEDCSVKAFLLTEIAIKREEMLKSLQKDD